MTKGKKAQKDLNNLSVAKKLKDWWVEKSPIIKFAIGFATVMVLFYIFYFSPLYTKHFLPPIINTQSVIANGILNIFGFATTVSQSVISGEGASVSVKGGCDGIEAIALLVSAILMFPLPFKYKPIGLLAGIGVLLILNLFRIAGLFVAQLRWPEAFDFLHLHGGFVIFTIASIALSIMWVTWALNKYKASLNATG